MNSLGHETVGGTRTFSEALRGLLRQAGWDFHLAATAWNWWSASLLVLEAC